MTPDRVARPPLVRVVDDDHAICRMLSLALASVGYEVEVDDGSPGRPAGPTRPDVALVDFRLARTSAADYLARAGLDGVPIVLMSASPDAARWRADLGAVATIAKPFDLDDLFSILAAVAPPPR